MLLAIEIIAIALEHISISLFWSFATRPILSILLSLIPISETFYMCYFLTTKLTHLVILSPASNISLFTIKIENSITSNIIPIID